MPLRISQLGDVNVLQYPQSSEGIPTSGVTIIDGVPHQRFRKELIREGKYCKADDNLEFEITVDVIDHWVATFKTFKDNGVAVPVPSGHTQDPEKNRGYVLDMFKSVDDKGAVLIGVLDLVGEEGIALAHTNDVSLWSPPEWVDGKGVKYTRPIVHVALTPYPVVPGLQGFESIAASLVPTKVSTKEIDKMNWSKVKEALGIEPELNDENASDLILGIFTTLKEGHAAAIAGFETKIAEATKQVELSHTKPEPDELLVSLASENREMKLSALVEAGKITPAVHADLKAIFVEKAALTLSLQNGGDRFDNVVEALAKNDIVKLGEKTGAQVLTLSQQTPNADADMLVKDMEEKAKAAGMPE